MEKHYYDGTKLLSMKDIRGERPEIYICTSNRTAGKTTYFSRLCVNKSPYKGFKEKFMIIYRFNYELDDCADKFFKDISTLFFDGAVMESERKADGLYHELFIDGISVGYAVALNNADTLKKHSHLFTDVGRMMMDEFQSETNHYCPREITKLISLHFSIARGQGKMYRYVPLYLIGNPVSLLNPYYVEMGISNRLTAETRFLKGDGFVLEQSFNEEASQALLESGFSRAFSQNKYIAYSTQNVYLNDNTAFIEKPAGANRYLATLRYKGSDYAVREYAKLGIIYCDDKPDLSYPFKISLTTDDHNVNYVMIKQNQTFITSLRYFFDKGCFRFKDLRCKEVILKALSY